ncbi:MAG: PKD domain-containing protein [Chitinophagaceae bacterium]
MKKYFLFILLFFICCAAKANHVKGGEVYYTYIGPGSLPNTSQYSVSLRLFRDCDQPCGPGTNTACLPTDVTIGIFVNNSPYNLITNLPIHRTSFTTISPASYPKCISTQISVCYEVATFTTTVELANNAYGYRIAFQTCCRASATNVLSDAPTQSSEPGATYECVMPGTNQLPTGHNSSAVFNLKVTLVCYQSAFTLDFGATDPDNDSLSYQFAPAYNGGDLLNAADLPPGNPLYQSVDYNTFAGFNAFQPLGANVTINSATGLISGISPNPGLYVVCVLVKEWRNGIEIGEHRKDFILNVDNCNIPQASLNPSYITCNGFDLSFKNETPSLLINSYYWNFGDPKNPGDTSLSATPTYSFSDSGTYTVTLITNRGKDCSDSAKTIAKVYPGFVPNFTVQGSCFLNPFNFIDSTTTKYGVVDSWHWNFGDNSTNADTADTKNAAYKYSTSGFDSVSLIVSNSKGCVDTVSKLVNIYDKPAIVLPFTDTLICSKDSLQLFSSIGSGAGSFSWVPNYNIINPNTSNPIVYPKDTTVYVVTANDKGCINSDSITVNVIDNVLVDIGPDTTICKTDSIQFNPSTNALKFLWSPPIYLNNSSIKNPMAAPLTNTTYTLIASVGKCFSADAINIKIAPYPLLNAGPDATLCYGSTTQLNASITAAFFNWSPTNSLLNANSLHPTAGPQSTTAYVLTVTDTLGCPKPVSDTVVVNVIPKVQAFAGNDTIIVANEPLQLNASGGNSYVWSPTIGMNDPFINNPVVVLAPSVDSITYTVKVTVPPDCFGIDSIQVIVFKTSPEIFIPTAFTPNGDGRNDILKPIIVGIKQFDFFKVFNRWGQLLYTTSQIGQGWDGRFSGVEQASGTYVFEAQAIDYLGNKIFKKGTVVLIR